MRLMLTLVMVCLWVSSASAAPIHDMTKTGQVERILKALFQEMPPLHAAALMGQVERVRALTKVGTNANARDKNGSTPLHLVAGGGGQVFIEPFMRAEMRMDVIDHAGWELINSARRGIGHVGVVNALLDAGANVNAKEESALSSWTPLQYAARWGHVGVVEVLLRAGANVEAEERDSPPILLAVFSSEMAVVKALLNAGARVNARDFSGRTPLYAAARRGHIEMVKAFIKAGAKPNVRSWESTPLLEAVVKGHATVVKVLLNAGANPNARVNKGWTLIHKAARKGYAGAVRTLLEAGANPNAKTDDGETPLETTRRAMSTTEKSIKPFQEIIQILKAHGARG